MHIRLAVALAVTVVPTLLALQQTPTPAADPQQPTPRFRGGANLVRLDAYVTANGEPVTDLAAADFDVLEDNVPQRVEMFELVRPRGPAAQSARVEPNTVAESRAMAADPDARVFVLFMDIRHVHLSGSYRAQRPIINLLDRAIGQDDLVGVMTPDMSARNMTLARRTHSIEGILKDHWYWGERESLITSDPRERDFEMCYPDLGETAGMAEEMILRRRERGTLDAIEDLIIHLEGVREERKFVILLSEGWLLPARNDRLARALEGSLPGRERIGTGPDGKLTRDDPRRPNNYEGCERERLRLAAEDLRTDFQFLLNRANRANVSFYPIDPRGLVAFDSDLSSRRALSPIADSARLASRQTALRTLAENTDGVAFVNTSNLDGALQRVVADTNSYYLLGYYSTNTKLDGRFRRLTVRVKRPGIEVRARPGYQAPTEAEAASARVNALVNGAAPGHSTMPPGVARALERLSPARGTVPLRMQATSAPGQVWITSELDATALKSGEWQNGGQARVTIEHETGGNGRVEVDVALEPGQRAFSVSQPAGVALAPGRHVIRLQVTPKGGTLPLQTTADVVVPEPGALISQTGLASRRGPSTGLQYQPTADARFRRTERLRLEIPRVSAEGTLTARVLGRDGQPLPLTLTLSERQDEPRHVQFVVADLTLAPLAQGEYVLEVTVERDGKKESSTYGFRIVP